VHRACLYSPGCSPVVRVDAGLPEVVEAYADLTVLDLQGGHNTKDNDLWIAESATVYMAIPSWKHPP
jgi:hypothetical protein